MHVHASSTSMETHMFKIAFLVEDKHLAAVLTSLTGKARELEVLPVQNAMPAPNGKVVPRMNNSYELFAESVRKSGKKEFNARTIKDLLKSDGRSSSSYSHLINRGVADKLFKRHEKDGHLTYIVLPAK